VALADVYDALTPERLYKHAYTHEKSGHLYIGTSSWLSCHVPFKKTDIIHSMAPLPSTIPGKFFIANEQETAGACLNFLRDIRCQIHADVFNRTVKQVQNPIQSNLRGAAFLAAVALGYLSFDDISSRFQIAYTYTPKPENRKIYDELYREFVSVYKRNKGIYARLNREN
jgi:sugar (pentulose or hexulose) kinase